MCTVTIIPLRRGATESSTPTGLRLAANRDELRTRPTAQPPVIQEFRGRRAILPIDPDSGGTWVAVNDAGLVMTLLNVNLPEGYERTATMRSRGTIIPNLLHHGTLEEALKDVKDLRAGDFPPFRIVLAQADIYATARSDGKTVTIQHGTLSDGPAFFTSSGLGDALVDGPRRGLFDSWFNSHGVTPQRQDALHAHRWPERLPLSVCMSRADARTVSRTVVEIEGTPHDPGAIRMVYTPIEENLSQGKTVRVQLD
ncbi:MAG: hypothetical protein GC164_07065 [Phycisphaera sp.]|nr:hypothetical protein [Phycisphaera sp.]